MISTESEERLLGRFFDFNDEPTYKLKHEEVDPWGSHPIRTITNALLPLL